MAKDDYFVISYRILIYLYGCLKEGQLASLEYLRYDTNDFPVKKDYWQYILRHLYEEGFIEGVVLIPILGQNIKGIKLTDQLTITPKGIAYLQENSTMQKAKAFLKDLKEIIPGM